MIKIEKTNKKMEYYRCNSCLKDNDNEEIYKICFGKTESQGIALRLCFDCLSELGNMAYNIYQEETEFLGKED